MSFDLAIRLTEGLLGFAVAQASLEHLCAIKAAGWCSRYGSQPPFY